MHNRKFLCLLLVLVVAGCAHRPETADEQQARIDGLAQELRRLSPQATPQAARHFATVAVDTSADLREQYGVRFTPWVHNMEVNSGTRPRGLCYHYAKDLAQVLAPIAAPYWEVQFIHAKPKKPLEHNAIVVTAPGATWDSGIVLDGWRNAGVLYFGKVPGDKYPWQFKRKVNPPVPGADRQAAATPSGTRANETVQ